MKKLDQPFFRKRAEQKGKPRPFFERSTRAKTEDELELYATGHIPELDLQHHRLTKLEERKKISEKETALRIELVRNMQELKAGYHYQFDPNDLSDRYITFIATRGLYRSFTLAGLVREIKCCEREDALAWLYHARRVSEYLEKTGKALDISEDCHRDAVSVARRNYGVEFLGRSIEEIHAEENILLEALPDVLRPRAPDKRDSFRVEDILQPIIAVSEKHLEKPKRRSLWARFFVSRHSVKAPKNETAKPSQEAQPSTEPLICGGKHIDAKRARRVVDIYATLFCENPDRFVDQRFLPLDKLQSSKT